MELVIKDVKVSAFTKIECLTDMADEAINKYVLAAVNKGKIARSELFRLKMPDGWTPYHANYGDRAEKLAIPGTEALVLGILGSGARVLGVHPLTTILATQDMFFKRLTWGDIGIYREAGLIEMRSVNKKKTLHWYLHRFNLNEEQKKVVNDCLAKAL